MKIAISLGGSSMVGQDGVPKVRYLKGLSGIIKRSRHEFGILTGGGVVARTYANAARELGASEYEADSIAITSTRQNAQLLLCALRLEGVDAYKRVVVDFDRARSARGKAVVMGGTIPGITTDTDAVLLAEAIGAERLVNISNVAGIFDSNPKTNPGAKKFDKMGYDELIKLASESDRRMAGTNFIFDMLACRLIARSKIETHFVSDDLKEIENAIEGKKHNGTVVG
jgi:uridylate kinase